MEQNGVKFRSAKLMIGEQYNGEEISPLLVEIEKKVIQVKIKVYLKKFSFVL